MQAIIPIQYPMGGHTLQGYLELSDQEFILKMPTLDIEIQRLRLKILSQDYLPL